MVFLFISITIRSRAFFGGNDRDVLMMQYAIMTVDTLWPRIHGLTLLVLVILGKSLTLFLRDWFL
jgi:hypothetical protein